MEKYTNWVQYFNSYDDSTCIFQGEKSNTDSGSAPYVMLTPGDYRVVDGQLYFISHAPWQYDSGI